MHSYQGGPRHYNKDECIDVHSLEVGSTIKIWGREMAIVGCNNFTREYYQRAHGIKMISNSDAMGRLGRERPKTAQLTSMDMRSHIGWRRSQRRQSVKEKGRFYGVLGQLGRYGSDYGEYKQHWARAQKYGCRQIRCKGQLVVDANAATRASGDKDREFVIVFDMTDETLKITEVRIRNAGHDGGLLLANGRHTIGPGGSEYFTAQHLYLGATLHLPTGQKMLITVMDEGSLRLCEQFASEFPLFDAERIIYRIRQRCEVQGCQLREALKAKANGLQYFTSESPFLRALEQLGLLVGMAQQEMLTLVRKYRDDHNRVMYSVMCDQISRTMDLHAFKLEAALLRESSLLMTMREKQVPWRKLMMQHDVSDSGVVGMAYLMKMLREHKVAVGPQTVSFVGRHFTSYHRGRASCYQQVDYHALCDATFPLAFHGSSIGAQSGHSTQGHDSRRRLMDEMEQATQSSGAEALRIGGADVEEQPQGDTQPGVRSCGNAQGTPGCPGMSGGCQQDGFGMEVQWGSENQAAIFH
ncbi:unnamed protein product [Chrysoparadoxa australica]